MRSLPSGFCFVWSLSARLVHDWSEVWEQRKHAEEFNWREWEGFLQFKVYANEFTQMSVCLHVSPCVDHPTVVFEVSEKEITAFFLVLRNLWCWKHGAASTWGFSNFKCRLHAAKFELNALTVTSDETDLISCAVASKNFFKIIFYSLQCIKIAKENKWGFLCMLVSSLSLTFSIKWNAVIH